MAIWARQFQALRDGDRFFYGTDPGLSGIQSQYGIDFHRTLSQIIGLNTDIPAAELHKNVFLVADDDLPATQCTVTYTRTNQWPSGFQDIMTVTNTGSAPLNGWNVRFVLPTGQQITTLWNGVSQQSGSNVTVTNASWNGSVAPGATVTDVGFNGTWDNATNAAPPRISLNNNRCSTG
jgi:cellulase/cellobiase CelA1